MNVLNGFLYLSYGQVAYLTESYSIVFFLFFVISSLQLTGSTWLYSHEIIGPTIRNGCERGWRWRWWWDAIWEEAAEDLQVDLSVDQGAVHAVAAPALACLARN